MIKLVRRWAFIPLIALVALVAGCVPVDEGVNVSGTIVGYYYDIVGPVTVTVTSADGNASVQVTLTPPGGGLQSGSYQLTGVPKGTYTLLVQFLGPYDYYGIPAYRIDGGLPVVADSYIVTGTGPYAHEVMFQNVPVNADETIDVDLGNVG